MSSTVNNSNSNSKRELHLKVPIIVKDLADALELKPNVVIHDLLGMSVFANINQKLEPSIAEKLCRKHDVDLIVDKRSVTATEGKLVARFVNPEDITYENEYLESRPPIVTFLGHVDHGKTSLLDKIRSTESAAAESGGITQHIGAWNIQWQDEKITFIDTPGHEAFTKMRARGAHSTDIVVLVIAADDGFMPQTIEAMNHAKAAEVPIIVAINKIDLDVANPQNVFLQMQQHGLTAEEWGGGTGTVNVSAMTGEGINLLLERILLEAEILELKANARLPVKAVVLEAQLEQGLGSTANILIKNGTVKIGDLIICGMFCAKVRGLIDSHGRRLKSAGPSTPVKLVGLPGVPESGMIVAGCKNEKEVKKIVEQRLIAQKIEQLRPNQKVSLANLFDQIEERPKKCLTLIIKTDVHGTGEAIEEALQKLQSDDIRINILHRAVGAVSESDVLLASASNAIIIGFHVRSMASTNVLAKREDVEIRLYSVIYELIEQIKDAITGMLEPEVREISLGKAEILQVFQMSKIGKICGCRVREGIIKAKAKARVIRHGEVIYNGDIVSLRHYKTDVREIKQGLECGIKLDNFEAFVVDDIVEIYEYAGSFPK